MIPVTPPKLTVPVLCFKEATVLATLLLRFLIPKRVPSSLFLQAKEP